MRALFRRAVELGLLMGGADRTTHLFGRQITRRYQGKPQTVLDRRNEGHPVQRSYYLSQLRYDLGKLRAHGFVERIGRTRRYRLTSRGLKLGVLLVKLRTRLLGPITTLATAPPSQPDTTNDSQVEAAFSQVDLAIDHLCTMLGLKAVA